MVATIIRRVHLYLALFLVPWMLVYAITAVVFNHREFFQERLGFGQNSFVKEYESIYTGTFPEGAGPNMIAGQILSDLQLDGAYGVQENKRDGTITIWRNDPLNPRRLIYNRSTGNLLIEREAFRTLHFLRRMHFRRGNGQKYLVDDVWAFIIDLVIFAIIFWGISGVAMWWKLKAVRKRGAIILVSGIGLFVLLLFTI